MTGIERHWKEVGEAERGAKIERLTQLQKEVSALLWELYPQQQYAVLQQNVPMLGRGLHGLLGGDFDVIQ